MQFAVTWPWLRPGPRPRRRVYFGGPLPGNPAAVVAVTLFIQFMPYKTFRRPSPTSLTSQPLAASRLTPVVAALLTVLAAMAPLNARAQLSGAAALPTPLDGAAAGAVKLAPQLEEHPVPNGVPANTYMSGEQSQGLSDQQVTTTGAAEIRRPTTVIKGDRLHYNQDTDVAEADGHVRLINNGNVFVGPTARMAVEANNGYMLSPTYHFNLSGGTGRAERIDIIDSDRSVLHQGTYTACQCATPAPGAGPGPVVPTNPAWYIRASTFEMDTGSNEGVARNAVLFFQNVPLFASPFLAFALNGDRRSGVLPPTFGYSSTSGLDLSVPYYFNLAPNRDLTFTPRLLSQRGVQLAQTFRYLGTGYSGSLTTEFLPDDRETKTNRYAIYLQHNQDLGNGFGAYVNYNRVSDDSYLTDLASANSFILGTQVLLQQEAGVTYNKGDFSVLARVQHWQTLEGSLPPYEREPQVDIKWSKFDVGGFDMGATADFTRFTITDPTMIKGDRATLDSYISYPIQRPGWFVVPKLQYHLASYNLNNITAANSPVGQPTNVSTAIPTASLDAGMTFQRAVHLFGQDYIETLEPRLYYVYTPYHNQNFVPLFDTAEADFGLAEIFSENTFVGDDRVADANRLTAAITTRFLNPATGDERARFVLAEQYYFRDQRTTLLPTESLSQVSHSDIIAGASIKLGAGFASQTTVQYNTTNSQVVRANVGFGWSPASQKVVNIGYRYTRPNTTLENEPINQVVFSSQWPLARRFYAVARVNYDMIAQRLVDGLAGFQYDADCWTFGIGIQRYANGVTNAGTTTSGTRVLAQLTLKGLSTVDNGLVRAFSGSVRGYTPLPPPAPPDARFSNYE